MDARQNKGALRTVFFVNTSKVWGGGELWHGQMFLQLLQRGWDAHLIAAPNSELVAWLQDRGVDSERIHAVYAMTKDVLTPAVRKRVKRLFQQFQPEHIILNSPLDVKMCAPIARACGVPDIIYRRGSAIPVRNTFLNRWLLNTKVDRFIANSEETKRTLAESGCLANPEIRIDVLFNGVDVGKYRRAATFNLGKRHSEQLVIGALGRLTFQKGFDILIAAMPVVLDEFLDVRMVIGGEGDQRAALEHQIRELGLQESITLTGFVEDTVDFFGSVDLFCLPSRWEGFGFVLAEAMASALPCIGFNVSNIPEIIQDNVTGVVIDQQDSTGLSQALVELLYDTKSRKEMGQAGLQRVGELFSLEAATDALETFLHSS